MDATLFDGGEQSPGIQVWNPDGDIVIRGLTVRNAEFVSYDPDDGASWGDDSVSVGAGVFVTGATVLLDSVRLAENHDGALGVGEDTVVTVRNSEITSNPWIGAGLDHAGAMLISEETDWGTGDDDNDESDVSILKSNGDLIEGYDFNGVASFTCSWDDQVCE